MKMIGITLVIAVLLIIPQAFGLFDIGGDGITISTGWIPYAHSYDSEQTFQYAAVQLALGISGAVSLAQHGDLDDAIIAIDKALAFLDLQESNIAAATDNPLTAGSNEYDNSNERSRIAVMRESLDKFKQIFEKAKDEGLSVKVASSENSNDVTVTAGDNTLVYNSENGLLKDAELTTASAAETQDITGDGAIGGKGGVKISIQKVHITYDKYGRAVTTEGRVYESGYDNDGNLILNKEYEMKRTVTEFTAWGAPKSESITTYDTSGAKDLTVTQDVEYEYDGRGRAVYTKTTTHEFGDRGPDASGDEDYERYLDKTTVSEETVTSFNDDGNPEEVHVVQTTDTGKGSMVREYDEHRDYENGRLVSAHQYNGTVTGSGDDGSNISYDFENTTGYTYNEIGQVVKTHSTEWSNGTFGEDTDITEYNNTSDTIYAYDIYGRTLMQLTETFDSANNTHYLSGFMADPEGSGFNGVGELSDQYSVNVHFGAQDGQGNFNYNMDVNYMDNYGFEQLFNMFLTGGTPEGDGYTGDGFYSGGGPIAGSWQEYCDQMAGVGMDITSGWGF